MSITLNDFQTFLAVAFVLMGGIATVGKAVDVIRGWRKPAKTLAQRVADTERKLDNDKRHIDALEEGNKALCRGMLALLNHEITGNSIEKLKEAQAGINNYLIEKRG